jgi:hypothetical protein
MLRNRISDLFEGEFQSDRVTALQTPSASSSFTVCPAGFVPGIWQLQVYQAAYERARTALNAQTAWRKLTSFSQN